MPDRADYGRHTVETSDGRAEARPADWLIKFTCLIGDCGWWTEWRGPYGMAQREIDRRRDAHRELRHSDGDRRR